jgi:hypothetical protein
MSRTIRAFVTNDYAFAADGIDVTVAIQDVDERGMPLRIQQVMQLGEQQQHDPTVVPFYWHYREEGELGLVPDYQFKLRFPEGVGQALLEGLARHYHGTHDVHAVRADLGHERERRRLTEDRLWETMQHMLDMQRHPAQQTPTEAGQTAKALADYLPAITMAMNRIGDGPTQPLSEIREISQPPNPHLMYHYGNHCLGHMPHDFQEECTTGPRDGG